jgi:Zinc knuckle
LTQEWKQIGAPSGGKPVNKALNIHTPESEYSPFPCHHCRQKGHKAINCPDRLAGKPKTKKNGNKGGKGGKKSNGNGRGKSNRKGKKELSEIKCYNCQEKGHYKNKCPKLKEAKAANVEVALNVQVVDSADSGVRDGNACSANARSSGKSFHHHGQVCKRMAKDAKKTWMKKPQCGKTIDPWFLYCLECSDAEESIDSEGMESISSNIESVHDCQSKIDSSKQASQVPKRLKHELSDDFFNNFGSESAEEDNSKANLDPESTPLWWANACEEFSLDSVEECEKFSAAIVDAVLHAKEGMKSVNDHGNDAIVEQLANDEDGDEDEMAMAIPCLRTGRIEWNSNDRHIPVPRGDNAENASSLRKRSLEEEDAPNTSGNDSIVAKRMAICEAAEKAAVCVDRWDMLDAYIQVVIKNDCGLDEMIQHFGSR